MAPATARLVRPLARRAAGQWERNASAAQWALVFVVSLCATRVSAWSNPVPAGVPRREHFPDSPRFHFCAPKGWMNDPVRPIWHDGNWHVFYNHNPDDVTWGNIHWGHTASPDLLHWTDKKIALAPGQEADAPDRHGVWTGSVFSPSDNPSKLVIFYTGATHGNVHWSHPHQAGSEEQCLAFSVDGGNIWVKYMHNPILKDAYDSHHVVMPVTGFRDPSVIMWPRADPQHLRVLISGGISGKGGEVFVYDVDDEDHAKWSYSGSILSWSGNTDPRTSFFPNSTNWECTNMVNPPGYSIGKDKLTKYTFLTLGVEPGPAPRPHSAYWLSGISDVNERVDTSTGASGRLDHGNLYAVTTFDHYDDGRSIVIGWTDEDLKLGKRTGWAGALGLPREVFPSDITAEGNVLGINPIQEIASLRSASVVVNNVATGRAVNVVPSMDSGGTIDARSSDTVFKVVFNKLAGSQDCHPRVVIAVLTGLDGKGGVDIAFTPVAQSECGYTNVPASSLPNHICVRVSVLRSQCLMESCVSGYANCEDETGTVILREGSSDSFVLSGRIIIDHNILEIFANNLFALTTRIYPKSEPAGITVTVEECKQGDPNMSSQLDILTVYHMRSTWKAKQIPDPGTWNWLAIAGGGAGFLALSIGLAVIVIKVMKARMNGSIAKYSLPPNLSSINAVRQRTESGQEGFGESLLSG